MKKAIVKKIDYYLSTNYEKQLNEKLSKQIEPIKKMVIFGTAGSGKTVLAEHVLKMTQQEHVDYLTFRLLAETKEQWNASLRYWAEGLHPRLHELLKSEKNPEEQKRLIIQAIHNALTQTPWCVLVDNWDVKEGPHINEIEKLFVGQGTFLITTQGKSPLNKRCSLDLSYGFSIEESRYLVTQVMNFPEELEESWEILGPENELDELTNELNHLPLALVLAGSYLLWENIPRYEKGKALFTFKEYQALLKTEVNVLIAQYDNEIGDKGDIPRDEFIRIKTQETAVDLSLRKAINLASLRPNIHLWLLLCFCGFIASDGIPQQLLKDYLQQLLNKTERELEENFDQIFKSAQQYSLLQYENKYSAVDNLFSLHIHRVVQNVLRDNYWLPLLQKLDMSELFACELMMNALRTHFSPAVDNQLFAIIREYISHIESWMSQKNKERMRIEMVSLKTEWAGAYKLLGEYIRSEKLYEEILRVKIEYYKTEEHIEVAGTQQNLASICSTLGKYVEAEELYQQAIHTKVQHYKTKDHIDVAKTQQNLAILLNDLGQYLTAEKLCQEALSTKINHYGTKSCVEVAGTQVNLANTLEKLERYQEAEELHREALQTMAQHYKTEKHIEVARVQVNLANALERREKYVEAERLYREALDTIIHHYNGKDYLEVAQTQENLAIMLQNQECYSEAEIFYREALNTKIKHYNQHNHLEVARTQQNLSGVLQKQEKYQEAITLYREALDTIVIHYKTTQHKEVAIVQFNLAHVFLQLKQYDEAKSLYEEALDTNIQYYGTEEHVVIAEIKQSLAITQACLKQYTLALDLLEQCEKVFEKQENYVQELEKCIDLKQNILSFLSDVMFKDGSLLIIAAQDGDIEGLHMLLDAGVPVNVVDPTSGWTALHAAVSINSEVCAKLLIAYGADSEQQDFSGQTPRMLASSLGLIEIEKCLVPSSLIIAAENDNHIIKDWQQSCYTLFGYGYRFAMNKNENSLTIERTDTHSEEEQHRYVLESVRQSSQSFLSSIMEGENVNITNTKDSVKLSGSLAVQELTYVIMGEIANEIKEKAEYGAENTEFCRLM